MTNDSDRDKAFYSAVLSAWVSTRMERDKTIIALSAAAVGLLATLLRTVGLQACWHLVLYILAFLGFLIVIGVGLWIFRRNASYLESLARGTEAQARARAQDSFLRALDWTMIVAFALGMLMTVVIGISSSVHSFGGSAMNAPRDSITRKVISPDDAGIETKSLAGMDKLKPNSVNPPAPTPALVGPAGATPAPPQAPPPSTTLSSEPASPDPSLPGV